MAATNNPVQRARPDSTGAPIAGGRNAPRTFFDRLNAAWHAMKEDPAEPAPIQYDPAGIYAWAQYELSTATFSRVSDDEQGARIAITLHELGNPLWRPIPESQADLTRRVRKAWPELSDDQIRKCLAHISARVRVEMMKPAQGAAQEEQREALRGNWVHGWRV